VRERVSRDWRTDRAFAFDADAREAFAYLEKGAHFGKVASRERNLRERPIPS
jgi:hypothetical protein